MLEHHTSRNNRGCTYEDLSDLLRPLSTCVNVHVGSTQVVDGRLKDLEQVSGDSCHRCGGVDVSVVESVSHRSLISCWHVTTLFMTRDMNDDDTRVLSDILRKWEWPASHMRYLSLAYTRRHSMIFVAYQIGDWVARGLPGLLCNEDGI
jgi:hypothetical protein